MTQALSESFCERCGTRYTFENPRAKTGALAGVRVLGKGLRKLALTRASSLDEALETARNDDEREANNRELQEFHGTFHFCLSCRQYTCLRCWNPAAGVCLTCAPTAESEAEAALEALRSAIASDQARAEEEARAAALEAARKYGATHPEAWLGGLTMEPTMPEWPEADQRPAATRRVDEWGRPIVLPAAEMAGRAVVDGALGAAVPGAAPARPADAGEEAVAMATTSAPAATDVEATSREIDEDAPLTFQPAAPVMAMADADPHVPVEGRVAPDGGPGGEAPVEEWLEPGTNLDDAIAAYEASLLAPDQVAEPQPGAEAALVVAAAITVEPDQDQILASIAEPEPDHEPVAAGVEHEPAPVVVAAVEPETMRMAPEVEPTVAAVPVVVAEEEHEPAAEPVIVAAVEPEPVAGPVAFRPAEPQAQPDPRPAVVPPAYRQAPDPVAAAASAVTPAGQPFPLAPATPAPAHAVPRLLPDQPVPAVEPLRPAATVQHPDEPRLPDAGHLAEDPRFAAWSIRAPEAPAPVVGLTPAEAVRSAAIAVGASPTTGAPVATALRPGAVARGCIGCGLSLSANARFCRRCGTRQG